MDLSLVPPAVLLAGGAVFGFVVGLIFTVVAVSCAGPVILEVNRN